MTLGTIRAMTDAEVAHAQAEVEVDRLMLAILYSLRADATGETLRAALLSGVLGAGPAMSALAGLAERGVSPPVNAPPVPAGIAVDLFAGPAAPVPPARRVPEGPAQSTPRRRPAFDPLRALVEAGIRGDAPAREVSGAAEIMPAPPPPEPAAGAVEARGRATGKGKPRPNARGDRHVFQGRPVSSGHSFAREVRLFIAARVGDGTLKGPFTTTELLALEGEVPRNLSGYKPGYLATVLKRSCIRIGRDRYWPLGRDIPDNAGYGGLEATPPEATHTEYRQASDAVAKFNARRPEDERLRLGRPYGVTLRSQETGRRPRR